MSVRVAPLKHVKLNKSNQQFSRLDTGCVAEQQCQEKSIETCLAACHGVCAEYANCSCDACVQEVTQLHAYNATFELAKQTYGSVVHGRART